MGGGRRREGKRQETKDQGTDGVAAAAAGDNQLNCFIGRATAQRTIICGDATTAKEKIIRKKVRGGEWRATWRRRGGCLRAEAANSLFNTENKKMVVGGGRYGGGIQDGSIHSEQSGTCARGYSPRLCQKVLGHCTLHLSQCAGVSSRREADGNTHNTASSRQQPFMQ